MDRLTSGGTEYATPCTTSHWFQIGTEYDAPVSDSTCDCTAAGMMAIGGFAFWATHRQLLFVYYVRRPVAYYDRGRAVKGTT